MLNEVLHKVARKIKRRFFNKTNRDNGNTSKIKKEQINNKLKCDWSIDELCAGAMDLYEKDQGYRFDLNNPSLFTEKVVWYKLFFERENLIRLVDKYLFKEYIAEKLGEGWTIPLIGIWEDINDLEKDWEKLPEEFCLKSTLQSDGYGIRVIHNRSSIRFSDIRDKLNWWLKPENTLVNSFCRAYYEGHPRLLAEEYKTEIDNQLYDYKVFCFAGNPEFIYVATDHFPGQLSHISFYDLEWNVLNVQYGKHPNCEVEKPRDFDDMLHISKILSKGFPFLRVDFFETPSKLYVAELTLYPGGGQTPIYPVEFNKQLGEHFVLPHEMSKK